MDVPSELLDQFAAGNGVIFVGAGLSRAAGMPDWAGLISSLRSQIANCPEDADFLTVALYFELIHGRRRLIEIIRNSIDVTGVRPTIVHRQLFSLPISEIFTTNYDDLLELECRDSNKSFRSIVREEDVAYFSSNDTQIIKLHGDLQHPDSIVITAEDYERFSTNRKALSRLIAQALQTKSVLFLGYSAGDPNLKQILTTVRDEVGRHARNLYTLQFDINDLRKRELDRRGLNVINLRAPSDSEKHLDILSEWLSKFSSLLEDREKVTPSSIPHSSIIQGKVARTERIVKCVRSYHEARLPGSHARIIRIRQGFSSLSLGDGAHADDNNYSNLLVQERDAFIDLLSDNYSFRIVISRRPIFTHDLYTESEICFHNWKKLLSRCQSIRKLIGQVLNQEINCELIAVYSPHTYLNDVSLGDSTLIRGSKSDTGPSYKSTLISKEPNVINSFVQEFEEHFKNRLEEYAKELGVDDSSSLTTKQILHHTIYKLDEVEMEIGSRVELLERIFGDGDQETY